jgi:hypothetical protein
MVSEFKKHKPAFLSVAQSRAQKLKEAEYAKKYMAELQKDEEKKLLLSEQRKERYRQKVASKKKTPAALQSYYRSLCCSPPKVTFREDSPIFHVEILLCNGAHYTTWAEYKPSTNAIEFGEPFKNPILDLFFQSVSVVIKPEVVEHFVSSSVL